MPAKTYRKNNGQTVEALQVLDTREGRQELTDFAGSVVSVTATDIFITSVNEGGQHNGNVKLAVGSWVIKSAGGQVHAIDDRTFRVNYTGV